MSSLLLIAPISVAVQSSAVLRGREIIHICILNYCFYFVIVGCEQLPLIFAELKVLIPDAGQAYTS